MIKQKKLRELPSEEANTLEELLAQVAVTYSAARDLPQITIPGAKKFGKKLVVFSSKELEQLNSLKDLIVRYSRQKTPPRPLCLGVFGPPGSGKSFAVKQILKEAIDEKQGSPVTTINLTQITHPSEIGKALHRIAEQNDYKLPLVIFDEFDAPRGGAAYGWLGWFLAPMEDGKFIHEGQEVVLQRAVYVFAGGTTDAMSEFSGLSTVTAFRVAKGPDFISRLRGFLDVQGPNAEPRLKRRSVLIRSGLADIAKRNTEGMFTADPELIESLLHVGRYRHGARSIAALIELSNINSTSTRFSWEELPEDHLLHLHVDRGPLDMKVIGGAIAVSGDPRSANTETTTGMNIVDIQSASWSWTFVAEALWNEGATLAYAGNWANGADVTLMDELLWGLKKRRVEPSRDTTRRNEPAPRLVSFSELNTSRAKRVDDIIWVLTRICG